MASSGHQFYEYQENVYKRYRKVVPYIVAGTRPNLHKPGEVISWLLQTPSDLFDFDEKKVTGFSYTEEVVETYSQAEDRVFYRLNRKLFDEGALVEYDGVEPTFETANSLTDAELTMIAQTKNLLAFKKQANEITSKRTLQRLKEKVEQFNRPISFIRALEELSA